MVANRRARTYEVEETHDLTEECYRRGWTDGSPVVPPTADRIAEMLDYVGLAPDHVIGEVPVRRRSLTAEQAAANAVMAGCLPAYFPVVLATLEVLFQYDPNCVHHASCTTNCATLGIMVNGPIRHRIGLNCTNDMLSPGNRANSTIGRAVRLMMINVFEQRPGLLDQGCMGSLAKHGVCFGEDEERSPWSPFHVSRGFKPGDSTVTVATIQDPEMVCNRYGLTAESVMDAVAEVIASHGMATFGHQWIWIVGYWHAQMLSSQGWGRPAMQQYVWERAWRTQAHLKRIGAVIGEAAPEDDKIRVYAAGSPEDIFIMAGGGDSGSYSEVIMIYNGVPAITNIINETSG